MTTDVPAKTFAVVAHSTGAANGYVVRAVYDGWCPAPYRDSERLAEYKSETAAQAFADGLNRLHSVVS